MFVAECGVVMRVMQMYGNLLLVCAVLLGELGQIHRGGGLL